MKTETFVEKLCAGDEKAFEKLVKSCEKRVYLLALRYTGNASDAMDLSQEVFIKAYRGLRHFKGESTPETWVYRIAVNTAVDFVRRAARINETSLNVCDDSGEEKQMDIPDHSYSPEAAAERMELNEALSRAIAALPEEYRQVLILRDINNLPYARIEEILRLNEGTVKSRLFRARVKLADALRAGGNFPACTSSNKRKGGGRNG